MWLKFVGGVLVIAASTGIGFSFARRYSNRPRQIIQLISGLTTLKANINYLSMPLAEALFYCGESVDGPVREIFSKTGQTLARRTGLSVRQAIESVLEETKATLALGAPEKEIMLQLGANLGATNREEQQKYLIMVIEELRQIEEEARRERAQNVKMFRYLGVCGGLTAVLLLV